MKSRSNSAFLVFGRALLCSLMTIAFFWLLEFIVFHPKSNLLHMLQIPSLWFYPLAAGGVVFLWNLSRKFWWRLILIAAMAAGTYVVIQSLDQYIDGAVQEAVKVRKIISQDDQTEHPRYENAELLALDPFPIYYEQDNIPIEHFPYEVLNRIVENIQAAPEDLKKLPAAMYLIGDHEFNESIADAEQGDVYGYAVPNDMTIYLRLIQENADSTYTYQHNGAPVMLSSPNFYTETILHEMAHLLDASKSGGFRLHSESNDFKALYEANKDLLSEYGAQDSHEFFAEAAVYWYLYPKILEREAPDVYSYFSTLLS